MVIDWSIAITTTKFSNRNKIQGKVDLESNRNKLFYCSK